MRQRRASCAVLLCAKKVSIRRKPCKPKQKLKLDAATQRVGLPPGQGKAASRKRVLRGDRGQPGSRSVNSEHVGCGIGPRKVLVAKADEAEGSEGHAEGAKRRDTVPEACSGGFAGVEEPGHAGRGSSRNWGGPVFCSGR